MREKIENLKNHIHRNRGKYGVATGIAISGYLAVKRAEQWNEFLQEHNLYDEFYNEC